MILAIVGKIMEKFIKFQECLENILDKEIIFDSQSEAAKKCYYEWYCQSSIENLCAHKHSELKKVLLKFSSTRSYLEKRALRNFLEKMDVKKEREEISRNLKHYEETYRMMSDDKSRETLIGLLMFRITCDLNYILNSFDSTPQYMLENIYTGGGDRVFDCGAYTGDTLRAYILNGKCPSFYLGFEPDEIAGQVLDERLQTIAIEYGLKGERIAAGVYSSSGQLFFEENGNGSSQLTEGGNRKINVVKIDDYLDRQVTLIKMDIEGSEYEALLGASKTIALCAPKLAICVYHKKNDLFEIPKLIKDLNGNYTNFFLRHYGMDLSETVLYATVTR